MIRMKYIVAVTTFSLVLTGCSSKPDPTQTSSAQELYTTGQQKLEEGNFRAAIKQFEALDNRYPFGPQAQQVQLNLIYAYYKSAELPMAIAAIDRFMRLNPTHPNIDYVLYMRGITTMTLDDSTIEGLLGIDRSDRDPEHARVAFRDLSQLVRYYPTSLYATDANKRLVYLKDRLAKYELSVVQYYNKRGAYVAVVNRVKQMLSDFPDTQATRNALPYMKIAYNKIGLTEEVAKTDALINSNPE